MTHALALTGVAATLGGLGTACWAAMHPAAQLFGPVLRRTEQPGTLALTFDDGPNPAVTPELLDLLDRCAVRASFFLIGRHAERVPELVREIVARDHAVANHTYTHPNLLWLSRQRIWEELERCQQAIVAASGTRPLWVRPPYGYRGPQLQPVVRAGGWRGVALWSRSGLDWKPQPAEQLIERLAAVEAGDIVLLHDGAPTELTADRRHVVQALAYWLPRWLDYGWKLVTVDELLAPVVGEGSAGG